MHVDLIGPYRKCISQHQPGTAVVWKHFSLTGMKMIDPTTGWSEIFEIPMYDLDKLTAVNDELIDKLSARVIQLFNNAWICRYPQPQKVVFDNGSEFKQDFTTLLKDFDIKPGLTKI